MTTNSLHPSYDSGTRTSARAATLQPPLPIVATGYARMLLRADRACCCSAMPAVIAVLPPVPTRTHRTELLFCMHHYRTARRGLEGAGATVVDASGRVLLQPAVTMCAVGL